MIRRLVFFILVCFFVSGCTFNNRPIGAIKKPESSPGTQPSYASSTVGTSLPRGSGVAASIPTSTPTPRPTPQEIQGSLFSILNSGDKKCTWTVVQPERTINGTAYVSGMKFRAEMKTNVSIVPVTIYVVGDGKTAIGWADLLSSKKYTFSYAQMESFVKEATSSSATAKSDDPYVQEIEKLMKDYKFRCETWTVDSSKFIVQ